MTPQLKAEIEKKSKAYGLNGAFGASSKLYLSNGYKAGYTAAHEEYSADREKLIELLRRAVATIYVDGSIGNKSAFYEEAQQLLTTINK